MFMEIAPGVLGIPVGEHDNVVYLVSGHRAAFIDSGHAVDAEVDSLVERWDELGKPEIAAIVLTHRHLDHAGGAARLAEITHGEIVSAPAEKEPIEQELPGTRVGSTVADGDILDLGGATLQFIHTPGHTFGSLCVYYREERILFTGDTVLGSGTTTINPEQGDMGLYLESLRKLPAFDPRIICPGHGEIISEPRLKIEEMVHRRLSREKEILDMLEQGDRTVKQMFEYLYPKLEERLHEAARRQILAHLVKLERDGRVMAGEECAFALR